MDAAVERDELFGGLGLGEESSGEPENSGDCGGEERRLCSDDGTVAGEFHVGENESKNGGTDSGDDFAPGADAPPIPPEDEHCASAGADAEDDGPSSGNRNELAGDPSASKDEYNGKEFADVDVMLFGVVFDEEAAVEVIDEIRSAPIELRADGGHEGSEKRGDHEATERGRKKIAEDHNVALFVIVSEGFAGREAAVGGIQRQGDEGGDDPGPGTKRVVRDVEPERGAERIFFVFGAEDSLCDVAAATGFGAGIPTAPPLDAEEEDEGNQRNCPEGLAGETVREVGEEGERIGDGAACFCGFGADDLEAKRECADAADFRDGDPSEDDDHAHFQNELKKVGDEYAPEATDEGVNAGERNQDEDADQESGVVRIA